MSARQVEQAARDRDVVARHSVELPESSFGFPLFFEDDWGAVSLPATAIGSPFHDHANYSTRGCGSREFNRDIPATGKIAVKQTLC